MVAETEKKGKDVKETTEKGAKEKETTEKEKKGKSTAKIAKEAKQEQHRLVRVLEYSLNGDKRIGDAIRDIKGIGHRIAKIVARRIGENKKLADLNEDEIAQLETTIKNLNTILPAWMLNHRNDQFTGENLHYIGSDLDVAVKTDIEFMERIKCYKGIRHLQGQPVRGQRTRTSFRTGKTVGVIRKKQAPAKAGSKEATSATKAKTQEKKK